MSDVAGDRTVISTPAISRTPSDVAVARHETEKQDMNIEAAKMGKVENDNYLEGEGPDDAKVLPVAFDFPEGGFRAWATVLGAFCIQFCGFGYTSSFGVYQDFYVREYITNESASTISWIGSVNAFIVIGGGLFAGLLYDHGFFKLALYGGSLMLSLGLFMLSLAQPNQFYQVFLAQGVCAGIGAGMLYVPSYAVVGHYFLKKRTIAMSIVASGSSLGAVIHPIMLNNTFDKLGFGTAVRASAGLVSGMLLFACLLVRARLPPPAKVTPLIPSLKKFSKDKSYILATLGMTVFTTGFYFPLYYIQLDAASHHLDKTFSFYSLVILNFCSLAGRLSAGFAAQAFGVANMITLSAGCCAAVMFGMIGLGNIASVVLVGVIFGFFGGAYIALLSPLIVELTEDYSEIGARMGVAFTILAFGGLVGSPISGALLGTTAYTWWRPAVFSGTVSTVGCGLLIAMSIMMRRHQMKRAH